MHLNECIIMIVISGQTVSKPALSVNRGYFDVQRNALGHVFSC